MGIKSEIDLAEFLIEIERRDCPHPSCHGELENVDEIEGDICQSCRCRPSGEYLPLGWDDPDEGEGFYRNGANYTPPYDACSKDEDRERYDNSEKVILSGGYEHAYWERINGPKYSIDSNEGGIVAES